MTAPISQINKLLQNGQHVFITGRRAAGKSSLFKQILAQSANYSLLQSAKYGRNVYLYYRQSRAQIGELRGGTMHAVPAGFDLAIAALDDHLHSDRRLLAIDEIGFLEEARPDYCQKLITLAGQTSLLLVLRKSNHALANHLTLLGAYTLIDLDVVAGDKELPSA